MDFESQVSRIAESIDADVEHNRKGVFTLTRQVAKRKSLLFSKKLVYRAVFRLDAEGDELFFSEMLKESGGGLAAGGEAGFSKETYKTGAKGREGGIKEQWATFGGKYKVDFDWGIVRRRFEDLADDNGWRFTYKITPFGV